MRKQIQDSWRNEFTVFGVFVAACFIGLAAVGALFVLDMRSFSGDSVIVVAPTTEEYRDEARSIMAPFFRSAGQLTLDDIPAVREDLSVIIVTTQERLIGVRVPSDERDAHLTLVLLMEHWKRALGTDDANAHSDVFARTQVFIVAHPWVVP